VKRTIHLANKLTFKSLIPLLAFVFFAGFCTSAVAKIPKNVHTLNEYDFSISPDLKSQVDFWKKIYSEYTTDYAVIHDARNLDIIYEVVYLGDKTLSRRARDRKLKKVKNKYKTILRHLARKKNKTILTGEEKRVHDMLKGGFYLAAKSIRSQIGQKDRFERGIHRSGRYMEQIRKIFRDYGLPEDLSVLPHVESSFHEGAYSSAGAAGIWQFTRGTGRLFMRVRYDVDERRDPIFSTYAAAKLLKSNFERLQSWPLAITAYNHGTQGMLRAKRKFGDNLGNIIKNYKSRTFGFASRNFYAEFLAALHVSNNEEKYFPNVTKAKPVKQVSIRFDDYVHISAVMKRFGMNRNEISQSNPALRSPVISGQKRIPRGFIFKAPAERFASLTPLYQKISSAEKFNRQIRSKYYTVRRGDTLSGLALRFGTSVRQLKLQNSIGRRNRIYVGKVLKLPANKIRRSRNTFRVAKAKSPSKNIIISNTGSYKVRRHDNLTKIARRFNTNSTELARLNGIKNPNSLFPGQTLVVPESVIVAEASNTIINSVGPEPTITPGKIKTAKLDLKSKISSAKHLAIKKIPDRKPQNKSDISGGVKVQLASLNSPEYRMNTNRPAFLPVKFTSGKHKKTGMGEITVDFDETISHYAEWAQLSIREVRRVNNLRRSSQIPVHAIIKVPFTKTDPEKFEERRQEFHKGIQEDFFNNYRVSKLVVRKVKKGETLWEICNDNNFIPYWLLHSYNPEKDIHTLALGEPIVIPIITPIKTKDS